MAGWGYANFDYKLTSELTKTDLPILSKEACGSIRVPHIPYFFSKRLMFDQLCAGFVNSVILTCHFSRSNFFCLLQKQQQCAMVTAAERWWFSEEALTTFEGSSVRVSQIPTIQIYVILSIQLFSPTLQSTELGLQLMLIKNYSILI